MSLGGSKGGRLFSALIPDDLQHRLGIGRLLQRLAKLGFVKKLGDIGQGMEVLLELPLRNQEQHDQVHRLIVLGVKTDAVL